MKNRWPFALVITSLLIVLFLGNPGEQRFIHAVAADYGSIHQGMDISTAQLEQIGRSSYQSYGLFSFYTYQFGAISVHYFGIGFMTFYLGNSSGPLDEKPKTLQS